MKQVILNRWQLDNAGTRYFHPAIAVKADNNTSDGEHAAQSTENDAVMIAPCAGTITNLYITIDAAPTAGKSWTFTVRKNGADTGIVVTIADAATTGSSANNFTVVAGDLISVSQVSSGTPSNTVAKTSLDFQGTPTGVFGIYGGINPQAADNYNPLGRYVTTDYGTSTDGRQWSRTRIPHDVTVTAIYAKVTTDPGGVASRTLTLSTVVSSTVTGTACTVTIDSGQTADNTTGLSVALSQADEVLVRQSIVSAPAASIIHYTIVCEATDDSSSFLFATEGLAGRTDGYRPLINTVLAIGSGAAGDDVIAGPTGFILENLQINYSSNVSALDTRVVTLQKNGSNTALTCTLTSGATKYASDFVNQVTVGEGEDLNILVDHTGTNTGTTAHSNITMTMFVPPATPKGMTTLFGM